VLIGFLFCCFSGGVGRRGGGGGYGEAALRHHRGEGRRGAPSYLVQRGQRTTCLYVSKLGQFKRSDLQPFVAKRSIDEARHRALIGAVHKLLNNYSEFTL